MSSSNTYIIANNIRAWYMDEQGADISCNDIESVAVRAAQGEAVFFAGENVCGDTIVRFYVRNEMVFNDDYERFRVAVTAPSDAAWAHVNASIVRHRAKVAERLSVAGDRTPVV